MTDPKLARRLLTLALALSAGAARVPAAQAEAPLPTVAAAYESESFLESEGDADADDPAVWVHPRDRARSLVLGTLKNAGLVVLDLHGRTVQRLAAPPAPGADDEPGRFNNVDLVLGFSLGGVATDLAVVTDRGRDKLVVYKIDPAWSDARAPLTDVTAPSAPWVFSTSQAEVNAQRTAYGLATARLGRHGAIGFVTQRERARIARVSFREAAGGKVTYALSGTLTFPSRFRLPGGGSWTPCADEDGVEPQLEGLVLDRESATLYAAQETVGIWRVSLDGAQKALIERVRTFGASYERTWDPEEEEFTCRITRDLGYGGKHLSPDAEGLTIYYAKGRPGRRYLSASSQGDGTFSLWNIDDHRFRYEGSYEIALGDDRNQESDGSHVVSEDLGPEYPSGLLVTHDGENTPEVVDDEGEPVGNTNFKLTPFDRVGAALGLNL